MKAITKIKGMLAMLFLSAFALTTYANTEPVTTEMGDIPQTQLKFDLPENDETFINIFSADGTSIFSDVISPKSKTVKVFDFSNLEEGIYTMISQNEFSSVEKTIEFKNKKVEIVEREFSYLPVFKLDGDLLKVSYLNATEGDIALTLENSTWIFHDEKAGNDMAFGRTLDTKKLPKGEYTLTLKVDAREYNYIFQK
jgi:hypothetical protein